VPPANLPISSASEQEPKRERLLKLLDPIIYGSIFDYPVTLDDMHRYCTLRLSIDELTAEIDASEEFRQLVGVDGDYYFLKGQEGLPAIRRRREVQSERAWRVARRVAGLIRYVPFVAGILATGSLAVGNVKQQDDLDFLLFVQPRRLWFVFFILGTMQRLGSRRYLCPNYYISTSYPRLPRQSFYVAREAIQARPVYGLRCCRDFYEANDWIFDIFPNAGGVAACAPVDGDGAGGGAQPHQDAGAPPGACHVSGRRGPLGLLTRAAEWLLGGRFGDWVEGLLKRMLHHRLVVHYRTHGQEVPREVLQNALDEVELRFHGLNHEEYIYREIRTRRDELLARLDGARSSSGDGSQ
jgi:hypothetical protein